MFYKPKERNNLRNYYNIKDLLKQCQLLNGYKKKSKDIEGKRDISNFDILISVGYWSYIQLKLFKYKG